mgnify:CR=1 FL=1
MANKYSKYSLTPYVSQYVDPGTVQVTQILRDRYDKNKAKSDLVERSLSNIQLGEGDQYIKNQAIEGINSKMAETAQLGNYEMAGGVIDEVAQDFATNEGLQLGAQSFANRQNEIKTAREIEMKTGKKVLDFGAVRDPETGEIIGHQFDAHRSFYQGDDGEMVRTIYNGQTEAQLDYHARKQNMLQGIAKSGSGLGPSKIAGLLERWTGVSGAKADRIAEGLLEEYLGTSEGMQEMRKLTQIDGMDQETAYNTIIQSMRDVAEKQVGQVPSYMEAPKGDEGGGLAFGNGAAMVIPGGSIANEGMDAFENVENQYASALVAMNEASNPEEKRKAALQLTNASQRRNNLFNMTLTNASDELIATNEKRKAFFNGKNADLQMIEPLLMELTSDQSFFGGDKAFGTSDLEYGEEINVMAGPRQLKEGVKRNFRSVKQLFVSESGEKKDLINQLSDIETINNMLGTSYTQKDLKRIQNVALGYYDMMDDGGDDLYEHFEKNVSVKTSDRIAFSPKGSTELNKVNNVLRGQLDPSQFSFITSDGDEASADEIEDILTTMKGESETNGVTNWTFAGLTMPDMFTGTQADMHLKVKGISYKVIPKDISAGTKQYGLLSNVANSLGVQNEFLNQDQLYDATVHGQLTYGQFQQKKIGSLGLQEVYRYFPDVATQINADPTNVDLSSVPAESKSYVANVVARAINIENNMLSLVGMQMGMSSIPDLRKIESDPSHPKHKEFKAIEKAFYNQNYDPKTMGFNN